MPIPQIRFARNGGPLEVEIQFGHAQVGIYTLILWESGSNTIVMERSGNNDNPQDDRYPLPLPTEKNDGRLVDCVATVIAPDFKPGDRYSIDVIVYQNETEIGRISDSGEIKEKSVNRELVAKLIGA